MLKSLLLMLLTAALFSFTIPANAPEAPIVKYYVRTTAIIKSITDLNFVINDIAGSNIPDAKKQVWVTLLSGIKDSIVANANDSLLQVK